MIFSKNDKARIEAAVKEAELKTSGEIVPVVMPASGDYAFLAHRTGLLGLLAFTGGAVWMDHLYPFLGLTSFVGLQALGWALGWAIGQQGFAVRFFLSPEELEKNVDEAALASFARNGLHHTKDRTGVLVLVSILEHRVEILADKGIHEKVGDGYWKEEVDKLIRGIREKRAGDSLIEVIRDIGGKLEEHFPRLTGDENELPNKLRSR